MPFDFSSGIFFIYILDLTNFNMKKSYLFFTVSLFILSLAAACKVKNIEKYNEDFEGEWRTDVYYSPAKSDSIRNYLTVDGKDSGFGVACDTDERFSNCLYFHTGKVKYNTSTKALKVGNNVSQIKYVTQEPFINENGVWEMSLDSLKYYK